MSQSDAHRDLVLETARAIQQRDPSLRVTADVSAVPGDPVPPRIGGYRPDIIARRQVSPFRLIIAEAKTDGDVNNAHTHDQIEAFTSHLACMPHGDGTFVLAVSGRVADAARTLLRFACRDRVSCRFRVAVFDGQDFWTLDPRGTPPWHLS